MLLIQFIVQGIILHVHVHLTIVDLKLALKEGIPFALSVSCKFLMQSIHPVHVDKHTVCTTLWRRPKLTSSLTAHVCEQHRGIKWHLQPLNRSIKHVHMCMCVHLWCIYCTWNAQGTEGGKLTHTLHKIPQQQILHCQNTLSGYQWWDEASKMGWQEDSSCTR